jgi:hypothetical protein
MSPCAPISPSTGGKKGDMSKFIEHAVRKEVLRATVRDIQERNAGLPGRTGTGSHAYPAFKSFLTPISY